MAVIPRTIMFVLAFSLMPILCFSNESASPLYHDQLLRASRLTDAGLYDDAAMLYSDILHDLTQTENEITPLLRDTLHYLLSEAYYFAGEYHKALSILSRSSFSSEIYRARALLLQGQAYHHRDDHSQAISALLQYVAIPLNDNANDHNKAHWILGFSYYKLKNLSAARHHFHSIKLIQHNQNDYYYRAQIYLARISLLEDNAENAGAMLEKLLSILPARNPIHYEASYILGEISFQSGRYEEAAEWYNGAIPHKNHEVSDWHSTTLYNMGWCYLKLGDDNDREIRARMTSLGNAIEILEKLISYNGDERAYLTLAKIYLLRSRLSDSDNDDRSRVENMLSREGLFSSCNNEAEALIVRAEAASDYETRSLLYRKITSAPYAESPCYGLGWYYRGLNDLKKYLENTTSLHILCDNAIEAFDMAFELTKEHDKETAALSLKYKAQALFSRGTDVSRSAASALLQRLITDDGLFSASGNGDELLYLNGFVAYTLRSANDTYESQSSSTIEKSLIRVFNDYPSSPFSPMALNLLGTFYFYTGRYDDAKRMFIHLAETYPQSEFAGDAWFWAAESAEWEHSDEETVKSYRRTVFECYPKSAHASEAYFSYYSFSEYIQNSCHAIDHLNHMEDRFPNTPHLSIAYYLLALNSKVDHYGDNDEIIKKKEYKTAALLFEKAANNFTACYDSGMIPIQSLDYFATIYYRSLLEEALVKIAVAENSKGAARRLHLESASKILAAIDRDFNNTSNPIIKAISGNHLFSPIHEESEYLLAQTYIKMGDDFSAERTLTSLLEHYSTAKITYGYYLSRAWYEQGLLAMKRHDDDLALKFFLQSEDSSGNSILTAEQKLDLWIQQSMCYRALREYDNAMLMLSKVINEDVASPLRVKAMYLRAEIYEMQGRRELALKQLEATVASGGVWGTLAQEKLEQEYAFF